MAARIIYRASNPNGKSALICRDTEWNQYIVQFFIGDEYLNLSDYYTSCKQDAFDTAAYHLKETTNG